MSGAGAHPDASFTADGATLPSPSPSPSPQALQPLRGLLRALAHPGVDALVLTTGEAVQVERGDKRAPLTQNSLSEAQIEALLAPTDLFAAVRRAQGGRLAHTFAVDGVTYVASALRGPAGLRLRLSRQAATTPAGGAGTDAGAAAPVGVAGSAVAPPPAAPGVVAAPAPAAALPGPPDLPLSAAPSAAAAPASIPSAPAAAAASVSATDVAAAVRAAVPLAPPASDGAVLAQLSEPRAAGAAASVSALPPLRRRDTVSVPVPLARTAPPLAAGDAALPASAAPPAAAASAPPAAAPALTQAPGPAPAVAAPEPRPAPGPIAATGPCATSLARARAAGTVSDVHLLADAAPRWRRAGALVPEGEVVSAAALADFVDQILPPALRARFANEGYADFACEVAGAGRLRANVSRQARGLKLCLRLVADAPRDFAALGLPPEVAAVGHHHQGLAIVAGPQGHGKSTTLAAILDQINAERTSHVILVEDPIEILHPKKRALFSQREVGRDTRSFARALKASLREDPDIIVIGELRDRETIEMALSAAETGHLVITTMNTRSAAKTIDRLIDMFPPGDQPQVRAALAGALKLIVSQRLLPDTRGGLVPAVEVVSGSPPLWALIRDNKLVQLPTLQQRGASLGMLQLDQSLAGLVHAGRVSLADALAVAEQPAELQRRLAQLGPSAAGAGPAAASGQGSSS